MHFLLNDISQASRRIGLLMSAAASCLLAACSHAPIAAEAGVQHAWVQADAQGGWQARAITTASSCPVMSWSDGQTMMTTRTEPGIVAARSGKETAEPKPAVFPVRSCEAAIPAGVRSVRVDGLTLPGEPAAIRRIVLFGDSGCRMKGTEAFQNCKDEAQWPLSAIARIAAQKQPDLVIHVGDLHYRESPCPAGNDGCAGSPWGYGYDVWEADLFIPAAPLLASAPWVFVRGNHEACNRAGVGWFRFLGARAWSEAVSCNDPQGDAEAEADFTPPYAVALSPDTQLIVFDSAAVSSHAYPSDSAPFKRYRALLDQVDRLAAQKPHNIFVNHHPVLGFGGSPEGTAKPGNAGLQSVMEVTHPTRLFPPNVDLVLNGHVHLFQALSFSSGQPAEIVVGNGGSAMEGQVEEANAMVSHPAPGANVRTFTTQPGFGFATLDRHDEGWQLTEWSVGGAAIESCAIVGSTMNCTPVR